MAIQAAAQLGAWAVGELDAVGRFGRFAGRTFAAACEPRSLGRLWRLTLPQLYAVGTRSVPVIVLVGAFVGAVIGVESYGQFKALGQEARLGAVINLSVVRQIGPVLAAVMIAGRVGGAVSAELGAMRVSEQIDALRVMGADPAAYLAAPRLVACVVMLPVLTVVSDLTGIVGGYLVVVVAYGTDAPSYWGFSASFIRGYDVATGLIKSVFFGGAIGLISCHKGFTCGAGAAGVGRAATEAFVASFIAIIVLNFCLAKFLKDVYAWLYGAEAALVG